MHSTIEQPCDQCGTMIESPRAANRPKELPNRLPPRLPRVAACCGRRGRTNGPGQARSLRHSRHRVGTLERLLHQGAGRRTDRAAVGYAYRFGDRQLNVHGPGVTPAEVARLPVAPGNSDLCFEWLGPIADAIAHLKRCSVAIDAGRCSGSAPGDRAPASISAIPTARSWSSSPTHDPVEAVAGFQTCSVTCHRGFGAQR
jgi:hypothetical protein